jgi:hypothetical protein
MAAERQSQDRKRKTISPYLVEVQGQVLDPNNLRKVNRWKVEGQSDAVHYSCIECPSVAE